MAGREGSIWYPVALSLGTFGLGYALVRMMSSNAAKQPISHLGGIHLSPVDIARLAYAAGWRGDDLVMAVSIALAESGGWTAATLENFHKDGGTSLDRGLYQINSRYWPKLSDADAFDPAKNSSFAHDIFTHFGWKPWVTYVKCAHDKYMTQARQAVSDLGMA